MVHNGRAVVLSPVITEVQLGFAVVVVVVDGGTQLALRRKSA